MDTLYTSLDHAKEEIRVLEIRPGSYDDDLVIYLHISDHLSGPEQGLLARYVALSYVWGRETSSRQALVNGKRSSIGHNLDCALRMFRAGMTGTDPLLLWVDAICINQDDIAERTQQILLMKKIYQHAGVVVIWLGPDGPDDWLLTKCIKYKKMPETPEGAARMLRVLTEFCSRPWFQRVWVAQELALARRDSFIILGKAGGMLWSEFFEYMKSVAAKKADFPSVNVHDWYRYLEVSTRATNLGSLRDSRDYRMTLCQRMYETAKCLATDQRDKVYGVLALLAPIAGLPALVPDYSKSVPRVFAEATVYMFGENALIPHALLPLRPPRIIDKASRYHTLPGLPSWALDLNISTHTLSEWGKHLPGMYLPEASGEIAWRLLRDTRHIPERVKTSTSFDCLYAWGVHIGTVAVTSGSALAMDAQNPPEFHDWRKRATTLQAFYDTHLKPRGISDRVCLAALTTNGHLNMFEESRYREMLLAGEWDKDSPPPFSKEVITHTTLNERILFVTQDNKMGAAYHYDLDNGIRPGDEVVGLFGINFPYVLRPVSGIYKMINMAHVVDHQLGHDFVKDVSPATRWSDFQNHGLREYTIV